ncbi:tRNA methylthiotransferase YqeV [Firmicutes bacterium CAG:137]|nr:tRNA methylthiotransferase YqeV [Firmicutes bacterium CAG:137]
MAATGYREIVITGIEIASWGWDLKNGQTLTELAEALCAAVPNVRIRLGSLEPRIITRDFCLRLSRFPNLCPQFHLSLQSGSDTVLVRMRRKYDTARYAQSVALLRESFPGCALTTDLIVGFPGETEAELEESLAFCRQCGFAAMHIFPYSRRPGTPADKMPGQLTKAEKEARSARAIAIARALEQAYLSAQIGTTQEVLWEESVGEGLYTGHTPTYTKVYAPGDGLHNQICNVTITGLYKDGLLGQF